VLGVDRGQRDAAALAERDRVRGGGGRLGVVAPDLAGGRDEQRASGLVGQRPQPACEDALERRAGRERALDRRAPLELLARKQRRDLSQRERVAGGGGEHAAGDRLGQRSEQRARVLVAERHELERVDARGEIPVREQSEQRGADRQPRLRLGRLELQRAGERRRLRGGQPIAQRDDRGAQLREARERQLRLRLETAGLQYGHAVSGGDRLQQ
jgi:hypothetical protein